MDHLDNCLVVHVLNRATGFFGGALCAANHPAWILDASAPGPLGTTVTVNFRFKPIGSCTDTLDSVLEYQLPPVYNDTPINEVKATCNKTIKCSGIEFKCVGAKQPYPMSFQHVPLREIKAVGGLFRERIGTFHHRLHAPERRF